MNKLLITASLTALIAVAAPVVAEETSPRTVIGVDISGTSTFLVDQTSADAAGALVENYIKGLGHPHRLRLISVGDAGLGRRAIDVSATVTNRRASSARRLAPEFGGHLRSLPALVERGVLVPQNTTSLIEFLRSLESICAGGNATAIIFSDGLEWSSVVDGRAFAAGKIGLPKPERPFLAGCHVKLLGVGQVKSELESGGLAERLIPLWRDYLSAAGADPVVVIGSGFSL